MFCATCFNNMHTDCFGRWEAQKRSSGQQVTCVYCRAPWKGAGGPSPAGNDALWIVMQRVCHAPSPACWTPTYRHTCRATCAALQVAEASPAGAAAARAMALSAAPTSTSLVRLPAVPTDDQAPHASS